MIKILGMLAIVMSSSVMGFVMAKELSDRTKLLKEIHQNAIHIKSDLEYRGADICECFCRRGQLFSKAYEYINANSLLPADALIKACDDMTLLLREDKEVLVRYAENLSKEDLGGQLANVSWLIENIGLRIRESERDYQSKSRLYKSGGAIVGVGFIILLL